MYLRPHAQALKTRPSIADRVDSPPVGISVIRVTRSVTTELKCISFDSRITTGSTGRARFLSRRDDKSKAFWYFEGL